MFSSCNAEVYVFITFFTMKYSIFICFVIYTGIKINNLAVLDSRGYSRSLIASRSIESYLIQVSAFLVYLLCLYKAQFSCLWFFTSFIENTSDNTMSTLLRKLIEDLFNNSVLGYCLCNFTCYKCGQNLRGSCFNTWLVLSWRIFIWQVLTMQFGLLTV